MEAYVALFLSMSLNMLMAVLSYRLSMRCQKMLFAKSMADLEPSPRKEGAIVAPSSSGHEIDPINFD